MATGLSRSVAARAASAALALAFFAVLLTPGESPAAALQKEAAQPYIFTADLEAQVDPQGEATSCQAEYTTAAAFAESEWADAEAVSCSPDVIGSADPAQRVTAAISGLDSDTVYRYRFVVTAAAADYGTGGTFHTFGVEDFTFEALDPSSALDDVAGSHPYELVTRITLPHGEVRGSDGAAALAKNILAELPPGLVGDPTAVEQCPARLAEEKKCSGDAQVGVIRVRSAGISPNLFNSQIFNVAPAVGSPARFGGQINLSTNAYIDGSLRTGSDYGINAGSLNLPILSNPFAFEIRLWGVPADPSHDARRVCAGKAGCSVSPGTPELAFLRNPTQCGGPLQARVNVETYDLPGVVWDREFAMPAMTECDKLDFQPTLQVRPTNPAADSPTGLQVDLAVPQNDDPDEPGTADLRDAVVRLPPGLTLNASSATGLESCSPAQIGLTSPIGVTPMRTTAAAATCPNAAKIGTVEVETPLLDHSLPGGVYVATPYENPFESLLAIYIAVDDPESGVVIKLGGHVEIGAEGQLTTTFEENPQLPFEHFRLDFFGGAQAALKTPPVCGTYATASTLTPWSAPDSGPPSMLSDSFGITAAPGGGSCPSAVDQLPNNPAFEAGSEAPVAGLFSPFVLNLRRDDGTQQFSSLTVAPPPGLLGRLAGIPYCPDAALAAAAGKSGKDEQAVSSCSEASRVGSVVAGAGAGPRPYLVSGQAYLAGPYKGAPLSLAIVTPAVAGPYDLGTVVVRAAIRVNPRSAQITVESDPIPTELKGIPLDLRSISVRMDRSGFTLNPTSCEPMSVGGTMLSTLGQAAALTNRYQVGSCGKLAFKPNLRLFLEGGTRRTQHPALKSVLTFPKKGNFANIAKATVTLPHSMILDQNHIGNPCTRSQFAEERCPKISILGRAKAWSPLLDRPLVGKVYFRANGGERELPDIVADLRGQIHIELVGAVDSASPKRNARIRTTFDQVPDAPVSRFQLELKGGKEGLLVNSQNLCRSPEKAVVNLRAHNGWRKKTPTKVVNDCGPKKGRKG